MKKKSDLSYKPKRRKWVDLSKTLGQLEGWTPTEPEYKSSLVLRCNHLVFNVRLRDFTTADLRVMIGQMYCLDYLLPLALDKLREDPLLNGEYYPGDLLTDVLYIRQEFWNDHADLKEEVDQIVLTAIRRLESLGEDGAFLYKVLTEAIQYYQSLR